MSGFAFFPPQFTLTNSSGRPYAGAVAQFFRAGTSTGLTVYTDASLATPHGTSVTASSTGVFPPVFIDPEGEDYKVSFFTSAGSLIRTVDNIPATYPLTSAQVGAALYPRTAAEIAASVTPDNYAYPPADVRRYGALGDGTTDDAPAFNAALLANDYAYVPEAPTAWKIGSTVSVPANKGMRGVGIGSVINKGANGAVFSLGKNSYLQDLYIDGKGATYTGVNITVPYTAEFEGYQLIENCWIVFSESYAITFAAMAGFGSKVVNCTLSVRNNTVECIQWPAEGTNKHGNRSVINCTAGSGSLIDCGNAENGFIIGCTSGDGNSLASIKFGSASQKIMVLGNRMAATTGITIDGDAHTFIGNVCGGAVTLASGATDCHIAGNVVVGGITDSSGQHNQVDRPLASYAGAWTGASSNPAVENGTAYYFSIREGGLITLFIGVTMGSSTTYGSGAWRFSVKEPCSGSVNAIGHALMYDSDATKYYTGTAKIDGGGTYLTIAPDEGTSGDVSETVPFTWASGDFIRLQITYPA